MTAIAHRLLTGYQSLWTEAQPYHTFGLSARRAGLVG